MTTEREALVQLLLEAIEAWERKPSNVAYEKVKAIIRELRK